VTRRRLALLVLALAAGDAAAHEGHPGYLELRETDPGRYVVLWKEPTLSDAARLEPVFPDACGPAEAAVRESIDGVLLARSTILCEEGLAGKSIAVSGLAESTVDVLVRVFHATGRTETHLLRPASPSVVLEGVGSAGKRIAAFLRLGVEHILLGLDHLLFVLGLLLIVKERWMLFKTITAFTVAHSITLAIATLGFASAPVVPLNAAIALSILFLGPEIVRAERGGTSLTIRHPWIVAFAFGLLHGFGFASGLTTMGLPRGEIPLALLFFNVGVELGQVAFVFLVLGLTRSFRVLQVRWPRLVEALPGYVVGSLGAYWTIQRTVVLLGGMR